MARTREHHAVGYIVVGNVLPKLTGRKNPHRGFEQRSKRLGKKRRSVTAN